MRKSAAFGSPTGREASTMRLFWAITVSSNPYSVIDAIRAAAWKKSSRKRYSNACRSARLAIPSGAGPF